MTVPPPFTALRRDYNELLLAAIFVVSEVKAEGATLPARLHNVWNRMHEIAHRCTQVGAASALSSAQYRSRRDLHFLHWIDSSSDKHMEASLVKSFEEEALVISSNIDPKRGIEKMFDP